MRPLFATILLLSTGCGALAQAPNAQITVAARQPNSEDRRENTSSTLQEFEFQAEVRDRDVDFNRLDFFTNAENSDKGKPRKQNIFVRVTRRDTGAPVPFRLTESGSAGGNASHILFLELVVPFPAPERASRIAAALKALDGSPFLKLFNQPETATPEQFFDGYGVQESKPGEYAVEVDYIAPSGKVSSKPLHFTIRDHGNLYEKVIRSIKTGG